MYHQYYISFSVYSESEDAASDIKYILSDSYVAMYSNVANHAVTSSPILRFSCSVGTS